MSQPKQPVPVMWFLSAIFAERAALELCLEKIKDRYGPLDYISKAVEFAYTDYYGEEMGRDLWRHFISLRELGDPAGLPGFKLFTNDLEQQTAGPEGRRVNLDPGYVAMQHLILATGKPAPHRPYLGQGIYADLTLVFESGEFKPLPWSYPDYASEPVRALLARLREDYKQRLRG